MKKQLAILMASLLFTVTLAFAHGNEEHVMGTVTNITKTSITVQTVKNETKEIQINDKTTFQNAGAPAKLDDLKVGDRVVIHADKSGDKLVAHIVQFGARKTAAQAH